MSLSAALLRRNAYQASRGSALAVRGRSLHTTVPRTHLLSAAAPRLAAARREDQDQASMGLPIPSWALKAHIEAKHDFNRWFIPPVAIGLHLCIGSAYAWSIFNDPLTRALGVVASSSADWGLAEVIPTFGVAIGTLGATAAVGSRFIETTGPRCTGLLCAALWGSGHLVAAAGVYTHCLPLVIGGYGVLGGMGLGLGYVTPVGTLIRWFPDRKGMAAGMAVAGFGGGAIVGVNLNKMLLAHFSRPPTWLGLQSDVAMQTVDGVRYARVDGVLREVVMSDGSSGFDVGVYLVGSGTTGIAETFAALGCGYAAVIATCALCFRVPPSNWSPRGWSSGSASCKQLMPNTRSVSMDAAIKTPQFWFLWTALGCNITAGIGIMGVATTMMNEVFAKALPLIVTPGFCIGFVSIISASNILGRFVWASASDYIGRRNMVRVYTGIGIPLYLSLPYATFMADGGVMPLLLFTGSSMAVFSFYGGMFATVPAYLGDLFGPKHVGGIHGRLLTAWALAGLAGPQIMAVSRDRASQRACDELATKIDPALFQAKFGSPITDIEMLLKAKTVTLKTLVSPDMLPAGMQDPTPFLYNEGLYTSAGLLTVAFSANHFISSVDRKRFNMNADGMLEDYSFSNADTNKDGVIDREEAKEFGITEADFEAMDKNSDGVISESEWEEAATRKENRSI